MPCIGEKWKRRINTLCANMDILKTWLDTYQCFELKGNLTDSTVWITGEMGDKNYHKSGQKI